MGMRGPGLGVKPCSCGTEKSHLLGASPCSSTPQGGPLYRWKKRGIFAVVGSGRRRLLVCLLVGQLLAHPAQVSQPHGVGGPLIAGIRCPAGVKGRRGHSPGERERLALRESPGKSPVQAPGPEVFPSHTVSEEVGDLLGSVSRGNRAILWVEGWASISPDRSLGTLCKWSDSSRVGNVTRGRLVGGGTECACANQVLARNQLALARRKAISWGPPHVLPRVKGDPFTDGRTAGYSHSWDPDGVAYGFASRWASGSQTGPRYLSPMVAEGRLLGDAGVLRGSRHGVGTLRVTQDACPLERPLENPRPRPPVPGLSRAQCLCWAGSAAGKCGPG